MSCSGAGDTATCPTWTTTWCGCGRTSESLIDDEGLDGLPESCWTALSRHATRDEVALAGPLTGRVVLPTSEFVAAIEDFGRQVITAMEKRIAELERGGLCERGQVRAVLHRVVDAAQPRWPNRRQSLQ
ncbi:DUF5984 family protein [Nonomuraea sp. NPDC004702]